MRLGRQRWVVVVMALAIALVPQLARAESFTGKKDWNVTLMRGGSMSDNYSSREYVDSVSQLQPGDDISFEVTLAHAYAKEADWYLSNEVISSLEDSKKGPEGGAYEYLLTYEGPSGSKTIYDSHTVGGTGSKAGLGEATEALDDYLYLDQLTQGQTARVRLVVSLDGESQSNAYFDTLAKLKLGFATDILTPGQPNKKTPQNLVKTGDNPWLGRVSVCLLAAGSMLIVAGLIGKRRARREDEEAVR